MFSNVTEMAAKGTAALAKNDIEKGAKKIGTKAKRAMKNAQEDIKARIKDETEDTENVFMDLSDSAGRFGEQMREWLDGASHNAQGSVKKVEDQINTYPVRSSLIALGVGVVIGALLRR